MPNLFHGTVTKTGAMAKTITVTLTRRFEHPKLLKELERTKKMLVHDELNEARIGDKVTIQHAKPFSRRKHFQLASIDARRSRDEETGRNMWDSVPLQAARPGGVQAAISARAATVPSTI